VLVVDVVTASATNHLTGVFVVKHIPVIGQRSTRVLLLAHARILLPAFAFASIVFFWKHFSACAIVISRFRRFTQTRGDDPRAFHTTLNSLDRSHRRSTLAFRTDVALSTHTTMSLRSGALGLAMAVCENTTAPRIITGPIHRSRRSLTALSI
jgi:hypothetical protein